MFTAGRVITWSKTGTGGSFGSGTSTTDGSGSATVSFTVGAAGVTHTVTATDAAGKTGTSPPIGVNLTLVATDYAVTSSDYAPLSLHSVTITAQLRDQLGNPFAAAGRVVTWSKTGTGGSFSAPTSLTNSSGVATVTFTVGAFGVTHAVTGTDAAGKTGTSTAITPASASALIQAILDGVYNGLPMVAYGVASGTGNPDPAVDAGVGTWTIATPAYPVGGAIDTTHVQLNLVSNAATLTFNSAASQHKYLRVVGPSGHPDLWMSIGAVTNDFDAQVQFPDPASTNLEWTTGGVVTLPTLVVADVDNPVHHYDAVNTPGPPVPAGASYTATFSAVDSGAAAVHRIGVPLAATYVSVSGAGANGSVAPSSKRTNRYGVVPFTVTAGAFPKTEHVSVVDDDSKAGVSPDVTVTGGGGGGGVVTINWGHLDDGRSAFNGAYDSNGISAAAGSLVVVTIFRWTTCTTVPTSAAPGTLAFALAGQSDFGGATIFVYQGIVGAGGYSGVIHLDDCFSGSEKSVYSIDNGVPASAATIARVLANHVETFWSPGDPDPHELTYPSAFGDANNAGFAAFGSNQAGADPAGFPSSPRSGWTELADRATVDLHVAVHARSTSDTKAAANYGGAAGYVWGIALEYTAT